MTFVSILGIIIGLIISWYIAEAFYSIAAMKGHTQRKYFWYCFLFGIAGWIMVCALPDFSRKEEKKENTPIFIPQEAKPAAPAAPQSPEIGVKPIPFAPVPQLSDQTAAVDRSLATIRCPSCNTEQRSDRRRCLRCGIQFEP